MTADKLFVFPAFIRGTLLINCLLIFHGTGVNGELCTHANGEVKCIPDSYIQNCSSSSCHNEGFRNEGDIQTMQTQNNTTESSPEYNVWFPGAVVNAQKSTEFAEKWCNRYKRVCGAMNYNYLINGTVGGEPAEEGEFPHMAAVGFGNKDDIFWGCGGSLISEQFVLTAAHCLLDQNRGPAQWVRLGTIIIQDELRPPINGSEKGQTHPVIERIIHPNYKKPSKYNDIALLKIGHALEANALPTNSPQIHPACLQLKEDETTLVLATGWGRLGYGDEVTPILQEVPLMILDKEECNKTFDLEIKTTAIFQRGIDESQICAGDLAGGKDTCKGDSGGPLQIPYYQGSCLHQIIGVTSFGKLCGLKGAGAVYTKVSYFVDWIEKHVWL